jgi:hypothetical protein
MNKQHIVAEIKRMAAESGGVPPGQDRFSAETGIGPGVWRGRYWARWSDALVELGFQPNQYISAIPKEALLASLVTLTRRYGHFPTAPELKMARRTDESIPSHGAFYNLGNRSAQLGMLRQYVTLHSEYQDVLALLPPPTVVPDLDGAPDDTKLADGSVYMLKLGKHYKIGHTFSVPRRHREIALELPEKPDVVHVITTDDPTGIEVYWHTRFASKRTNGEWFELSRDDIRAFKRRKFM